MSCHCVEVILLIGVGVQPFGQLERATHVLRHLRNEKKVAGIVIQFAQCGRPCAQQMIDIAFRELLVRLRRFTSEGVDIIEVVFF